MNIALPKQNTFVNNVKLRFVQNAPLKNTMATYSQIRIQLRHLSSRIPMALSTQRPFSMAFMRRPRFNKNCWIWNSYWIIKWSKTNKSIIKLQHMNINIYKATGRTSCTSTNSLKRCWNKSKRSKCSWLIFWPRLLMIKHNKLIIWKRVCSIITKKYKNSNKLLHSRLSWQVPMMTIFYMILRLWTRLKNGFWSIRKL